MGPNGIKYFKTLLLPQIAVKSFQTCPEFFSKRSSPNYVWDFLNVAFLIFNNSVFENFKFTIVPYEEAQNTYRYLENEQS